MNPSAPTPASEVVLNVVATDGSASLAFLTVYPAGTARPLASNLNFAIFNSRRAVDVIADVQGWFLIK